MKKPLFTFLTAHMWSRPNLIHRAAQSLQAQTDKDFEHLVYMDHHPGKVENMYLALPQLAKAARGTYIHILDDDDWMVPDFIERVKATLKGDTPDYFATHFQRLHPGNERIKGVVSHLPKQSLDAPPQMGAVTHAMINLKTPLYLKYADEGRGYLDNEGKFIYAGDYWLIKKLWDEGLRAIDLGFVGSQGFMAGLGGAEANVL